MREYLSAIPKPSTAEDWALEFANRANVCTHAGIYQMALDRYRDQQAELLVGRTVTVDWQLKLEGNGYSDGANWHGETVIGTRKMFGQRFVLLNGRPRCPVRVERITPQ